MHEMPNENDPFHETDLSPQQEQQQQQDSNDHDSSSVVTLLTPSWPTTFTSILQKRRLKCHLQTPDSWTFRTMYKSLLEEDDYFSEVTSDLPPQQHGNVGLSREVERTLFDAFADDDFDGTLHLLTVEEEDAIDKELENEIHPNPTNLSNRVLGIVFWRDVPHDEMKDWLNVSNKKNGNELRQLFGSSTLSSGWEDHGEHSNQKSESLHQRNVSAHHPSTILPLVRQHSALSIHNMNQEEISHQDDEKHSLLFDPKNRYAQESKFSISHAWIKIELLAVRKQYWGRRLGSLLLACCLYQAYVGTNNKIPQDTIRPKTLFEPLELQEDVDDEKYPDELDSMEDNSWKDTIHDPSSRISTLTKPGTSMSLSMDEFNRSFSRILPHNHLGIGAQHCVLHVAGGIQNIPALKLYHRFGFVPASHLFVKPNKDLYVLGDIGHSLEALFYGMMSSSQKERRNPKLEHDSNPYRMKQLLFKEDMDEMGSS